MPILEQTLKPPLILHELTFTGVGGDFSRDYTAMPQPQYLGAKYKLLP